MTALTIAMDRATVRTVDGFGRMYVEVSNISKAMVCPYYGSEIPNAASLGLDAARVYQLLRDPGELAKGAGTFNNLPLLDRHIPVTAEKPSKEFIVGSTGTDSTYDDPYLRNSLVIWDAAAIAGIRTKEICELSSAYAYDADMTPGVYEGVPYDGIMRNIRGNHVALVEVGRAGPDVVVGDSKLLEKPKMSKKLSANGNLLRVAIMAALPPVLAQDAQIGDLTAIVGSVKSLKTAKQKQAVIAAVEKHFTPLLAQDAKLPDLTDILNTIAQDEEPEPKPVTAADADPDDEDDEAKKKRLAAEAMAADGDDDETVSKPAMDAAIAKTRRDTIAEMNAIHAAVADVRPLIGELAIAQDSAEAVYKLALDAAKVDVTGVHPSAYKAMVKMLPKPGETPVRAVTIAQDSANGAKSFNDFFPNASKMKGGV